MKGSKLFKNVRLKGQKELVSILVEDGIFKKIAADIPQEKTVGCEEVDLNGQLVVPPYGIVKCSQFPSCVDFTGFNCIQNCVYCYYLSFFSKIALKHRPHYFHI